MLCCEGIELREKEIVFDPPFHPVEEGTLSLQSIIDGWLKDFFAMATTMQRLDSSTGDYLNEMKEHFQMQCLLALVRGFHENSDH